MAPNLRFRFHAMPLARTDGGGTPAKRRSLEIYAQCMSCKDCVNLTLWTKDSNVPDVLSALLEPIQDARVEDGMLMHAKNNCGGVMRAINLPYRIRLDGQTNTR